MVAAAAAGLIVFGTLDFFRSGPAALVPDVVLAIGTVFWPFAPARALTVAWIGAITQLALEPSVIFGDAFVLPAVYFAGRDNRPWVRWFGFVSSIVGGLAAGTKLILVSSVLLPSDPQAHHPAELALYYVAVSVMVAAALALFLALGLASRTRRALSSEQLERSESEQERLRAELRVAQEAERIRISREMHDAIGHALAVVIAQSDGARYALAQNPDAAADALAVINRSARGALDDVATALSALAPAGDDEGNGQQAAGETPDLGRARGLRDLDGLLAATQSAGLPVARIVRGTPRRLPTRVEHAVFRVAQESLTNALKHGGAGSSVRLTLDWTDEALELESQTTEPRRAASRSTPVQSGGRGLAGMRERLRLVGGSFSASPRVDGVDGFRVWARFPYEREDTP